MAKRFTDTDLWDKEWFMSLAAKHKLLIQFIFSKCDQAGVWNPNYQLASIFIGTKITKDDLQVLKNQIEFLPDGKIFIPDFVNFQYGALTEKCNPHKKIISLLKNHGLYERVKEGYLKGISTQQDKEEEEDKEIEEEKDEEQDKEKGGENQKIVYPFDTPEFMQTWELWKNYKKERGERYKPIGEQAALKKLSRLANARSDTAIAIINQSIENNWIGLFELKNSNHVNGTNNNSGGKGTKSTILESLSEFRSNI